MNDGAAIVARLQPLRLPADFATFGMQDLLTLFGVGLLIGLAIIVALRLVIARQRTPLERARSTIAAVAAEPAERRLLNLARLRAELLPQAGAPAWRDALYRPDRTVDFSAIEAEILTALQRDAA